MKLIVLERVDQLRKKNPGILDDLTMEILRVLSSPDIDVRKKALEIAMEIVSSKNVEEVVMLLKKELSKTVDEQYEKVWSEVFRDLWKIKLINSRTMSIDSSSSIPFINVPSNFQRLLLRWLTCSWTLLLTSMQPLQLMLFHL